MVINFKSINQKQYQQIEQEIRSDKHEVVSFDIWDTLIERPFIDPRHLFFLLEKMYDEPGFGYKRMYAEQYARLKLTNAIEDDITYDEIYDYIAPKWQYLKEIEVQTEIKYAKARPEGKQLYELAISLNKPVLIISDMYLPFAITEEILHKNGYIDYEKLYLSSVYKKSKATGLLYQHMQTEYPNQKMVHIGDNRRADVDMANQHGLTGMFIEKSFFTTPKYKHEQNIVQKLFETHKDTDLKNHNPFLSMVYRAINKYKEEHPEIDLNNKDNNIAISYFLPLALYYCFYVKSLINDPETPFNKPWFSTRDCNIMKEMYDVLYPEDNSELFYSSRLFFAGDNINALHGYINNAMHKYTEPDKNAIIKTYGSEIAEIISASVDKFNKKMKKSGNVGRAASYMQHYQQIVTDVTNHPDYIKIQYEKNQNIKQVIEHIGINKPENLIVDLGWKGTIQNGLCANILNFKPSFVYFYKREIDDALPNTLSLFATHQKADDKTHEFATRVESMFSHYTSTVKKCSVVDGKLQVEFVDDADRETKIKKHSKLIEQTAIHFCQWFVQQDLFNPIYRDITQQSDFCFSGYMQEFMYETISEYDNYSQDIYFRMA